MIKFGIDPAAKNIDNKTAAAVAAVLMKPHHNDNNNQNHAHQTLLITSSYVSETRKLCTSTDM